MDAVTPKPTTLFIAASLAMFALIAYIVTLETWRKTVEGRLQFSNTMQADVSTALQVVGDHGSELQLIRTQIEGLRGALDGTRVSFARQIDAFTSDRFRGSDWARESEIIDLRIKAVDEQIAHMEARIDEHHKE